ncbi:MAG: hypothetical protein HYV09_15660 [Deltaproteobacteria bacterium]|nr:hypothetical protein [Deltaproteobacteria bacterium]
MTKVHYAIAAAGLTLSACMGVGNRIDVAKVQQIQNCETTPKQLLEWFGEPQSRGMQSGYATMNWYYARAGIGTAESQNLWAYIGKNGKVVDFAWNPPGGNYNMKDNCKAD